MVLGERQADVGGQRKPAGCAEAVWAPIAVAATRTARRASAAYSATWTILTEASIGVSAET